MNLVSEAERNISGMTPAEFEKFLVWLRDKVSVHLGTALPISLPSAQELADRQSQRLMDGSVEPFRYVDIELLPEPARNKARKIIKDWRERNGS